jgi:hypothetical protein
MSYSRSVLWINSFPRSSLATAASRHLIKAKICCRFYQAIAFYAYFSFFNAFKFLMCGVCLYLLVWGQSSNHYSSMSLLLFLAAYHTSSSPCLFLSLLTPLVLSSHFVQLMSSKPRQWTDQCHTLDDTNCNLLNVFFFKTILWKVTIGRGVTPLLKRVCESEGGGGSMNNIIICFEWKSGLNCWALIYRTTSTGHSLQQSASCTMAWTISLQRVTFHSLNTEWNVATKHEYIEIYFYCCSRYSKSYCHESFALYLWFWKE